MSDTKQTTIIEINGVKMEVDLRHATVVHNNLRIGSKVKLLAKSTYGGNQIYSGVIVAFDAFPSAPSITVAYVKTGYGTDSPLQFAVVNTAEKCEWEMVPSLDDELPIRREQVLEQIDRAIEEADAKGATLRKQRDYFLRMFGTYFGDIATAPVADSPF